MTTQSGGPPAGWYPDPAGEHSTRYWDGSAWTDQVGDEEPTTPEDTQPWTEPDPLTSTPSPMPLTSIPGFSTLAGSPSAATPSPPASDPSAGAGSTAAPPRLHILQKITPFQNVYRVFWDAGGQPGQLVAFVKQKRMALKEAFTVYADESASRPVLAIKADRRIDIRSAMTVTDPTTGHVVGTVKKLGAQSLLRSTWEMEQPGLPTVTITERSLPIAILRRVWGLVPYANNIPVPWVFHFDAVAGPAPVFTHTRVWGWRDRYVMEIQDQRLDFRMAIAIGILMDAMQHR